MLTIGIDLGGTNIKGALIHRDKGILESFSISTDAEKGKDHVINRVAELINTISSKAGERPYAAGIGSPGVISFDRTTVSNPPNFPGWITENLAEILKSKTGLDCYVDNDANLMALGSSRFGAGKAYDSFIMITLGTGVGGGIIYQNRLFRGANGGAAELGHVIIDYNGPRSNSPAQGGIEAYLGQRFLSRLAWNLIKNHPQNKLYQDFYKNPDQLEPADLTTAAHEGNDLAVQILKEAGEKLGVAIVNYIHILDIRKIIVSGGVSRAGDLILAPAKEKAFELLLEPYKQGFELVIETIGNDAALLGAGCLPLEHEMI